MGYCFWETAVDLSFRATTSDPRSGKARTRREIPRMSARRYRFREFYPRTVPGTAFPAVEPIARETSAARAVWGEHLVSAIPRDAFSGFLDVVLSLPLCGIPRPRSK